MNRLPTQISSMASGGGNHYIIEVQCSEERKNISSALIWEKLDKPCTDLQIMTDFKMFKEFLPEKNRCLLYFPFNEFFFF